MCGLYSLRQSSEAVRALFGYEDEARFPPRPYVAPAGPIGIVRQERGARRFALVLWNFVPGWSKEIRPGRPLINARAETVMEKPTFRNALLRRRCLVPADGYYEWRGEIPGRKQPFHIHRPDHGLIAFAGLWEHWQGPDGSELETAAILTTTASPDVADVHERMPVIVAPEHFLAWLDVDRIEAREILPLLAPAPAGLLVAEPTIMERPKRPSAAPEQASLF